MIERAGALAAARETLNIDWLVGSAYELPFADDVFDVVTSHLPFHHLQEPLSALRELLGSRARAAQSWSATLSRPTIRQRPWHSTHSSGCDPSTVKFFTERELRALFADLFQTISDARVVSVIRSRQIKVSAPRFFYEGLPIGNLRWAATDDRAPVDITSRASSYR